MSKKRKTKAEKVKTTQRNELYASYSVNPNTFAITEKKLVKSSIFAENDLKFFRADLTKTFIVSMLVVALELAMWLLINRR